MEMRRSREKWWCIPRNGGRWLEFLGEEDEIEWLTDDEVADRLNDELTERIENELKKITDFMHSGQFVDSIETILQRNANTSVMTSSLYQDFLNKKENTVGSVFGSPTFQPFASQEEMKIIQDAMIKSSKPKTTIGYVYIDDNGEQKFSPSEPEGITSTPVYGD